MGGDLLFNWYSGSTHRLQETAILLILQPFESKPLKSWGFARARLMCSECEILMEAPESEGEGEDQEEAA
ncbi:protein of unknown function (plasmid) [Aminobacter niigataensis]|nr:protein of unknown function [Aminobacter niigataensis]